MYCFTEKQKQNFNIKKKVALPLDHPQATLAISLEVPSYNTMFLQPV